MTEYCYLDASAWVKRYMQKTGSDRIATLFGSAAVLVCSSFGYLEVLATIARRPVARKLGPVALEEMLMADRGDLVLFDVTPDVINRAVTLARQFSLRGADAVHLATALIVREKLVDGETLSFVCSDTELPDAASRNSFEILNPAVA